MFQQDEILKNLIDGIAFEIGEYFQGVNYVVEIDVTILPCQDESSLISIINANVGLLKAEKEYLKQIEFHAAKNKLFELLASKELNSNRNNSLTNGSKAKQRISKLFELTQQYLRPGKLSCFTYNGAMNIGIFWELLIILYSPEKNEVILLKCSASD